MRLACTLLCPARSWLGGTQQQQAQLAWVMCSVSASACSPLTPDDFVDWRQEPQAKSRGERGAQLVHPALVQLPGTGASAAQQVT